MRPNCQVQTSKRPGRLQQGLRNLLLARAWQMNLSIGFVAGACAIPVYAAEHVRVTQVELDAANETEATLRIHGAELMKPAVFRLSNPARLVIDVPNADIAGVKTPAVDQNGLIRAVTTTQFQGASGHVARIVAVMRTHVDFEIRHTDKAVTLAIRAGKKDAPQTTLPDANQVESTDLIELSAAGDANTGARKLLGVEANERAGGSVVRVTTDGVVERYEVEEVESPPRLVIDLFGVRTGRGGKKKLTVPGLSRVRVGKHRGKTRVVVDGKNGQLPRYEVASTGEGLLVVFDEPGAVRSQPDERGQLTNVSLSAKKGFYRLALDVASAPALRTLKDTPREKILLMEGVQSTEDLLGRKDYQTGPVDAVEVTQQPRGTQIRLLLSQSAEDSVWQRQGTVFWDVRNASAGKALRAASPLSAPAAESGLEANAPQPRAAPYSSTLAPLAYEGATARRYKGKRITIDMMDADIVNVLRLIGDVSGKNVVVGDDVKGKVSIKLANVPWDQALDVILRTKGMDQEVRGGIIRVAPKALLDKERDARLRLEDERRKKIPTTVRLVPVNYAVASELTPQIKELLSERGRVTFDERTNVIIVEDIRDNLEQAERLVRTLDTQTPQVLIEARMVEASTTFTRALGIQWGGGVLFSERTGNPTGLIFPNNVGIVGGADTQQQLTQPTPGIASPSNFAVNLPADDVTTGVGLNLGSVGNYGFLNARLTAAESSGMAKTISAPKVTTLNNKTARIFQGQDLLITTVTQNQLNTNQIQARLDLEVTPHVTADGSVLMKVVLSNNQPNFQQTSGGNATINTKGAETELLVKDGDTAVIGGIYTRNFGEEFNETPFLGKIPLLGWLFKSYSSRDERNEMLVFLTPRIINRRSFASSGMAPPAPMNPGR